MKLLWLLLTLCVMELWFLAVCGDAVSFSTKVISTLIIINALITGFIKCARKDEEDKNK